MVLTFTESHLSRSLSLHPLNMQVLAVEGSQSQLTGSARLDALSGSQITYKHVHLDVDTIEELVRKWSIRLASTSTGLVGALHACGNLAVDTLQVMLKGRETPVDSIIVGCCYNLLDSKRKVLFAGTTNVELYRRQPLGTATTIRSYTATSIVGYSSTVSLAI